MNCHLEAAEQNYDYTEVESGMIVRYISVLQIDPIRVQYLLMFGTFFDALIMYVCNYF